MRRWRRRQPRDPSKKPSSEELCEKDFGVCSDWRTISPVSNRHVPDNLKHQSEKQERFSTGHMDVRKK